MPELAELKLSAQYINESCKDRKRTIHHVSDWKETFSILKSINSPAMAPNGNLINKI